MWLEFIVVCFSVVLVLVLCVEFRCWCILLDTLGQCFVCGRYVFVWFVHALCVGGWIIGRLD